MNWDTAFSAGPNGYVTALDVFDSGQGPELYVGGYFSGIYNGPCCTYGIAKWNGTSWSTVGDGVNEEVDALHVFDDGSGPSLYLGGGFTLTGATPADHVARWNGVSFSALAPGPAGGFQGTNAWVRALATFDDGTGPALYAAGVLPRSNGVPLNHVARWTGSQWIPLGSGITLGPSGRVYAMKVFDDGTGPALFVAGYFTAAGGLPASGLAKWDGTSWTPVGVGIIPIATALEIWDDGGGPALYMSTGTVNLPGGGSTFGLVKWDGTTWSDVGQGTNGAPFCLAAMDDGSGPALFAAGPFTWAGNVPVMAVAKWNGSRWNSLGSGIGSGRIPYVYTMGAFAVGSGGRTDLYAGGFFGSVGASIPSHGIARWRSCDEPIETMCLGDGTFAFCPCFSSDPGPPNLGSPGHGCNNSLLNGGARLAANGSPSPDTITLRATNELPTALTIFLQGSQVIPVVPFGDGLRCVGGNLKRIYTKAAVAGAAMSPAPGEPSISSRSAALGDPIAPGSLRYYQTYYRDPGPYVPICPTGFGGTFNASNGVRIVW